MDRGVRLAMRRALKTWPELSQLEAAFGLHVQKLAVPDAALRTWGHELYLAFSCARADAAALLVFERQYLAEVVPAITRVDASAEFVDEVCQALRERLLVAPDAKIETYAATGSLVAWLRVSALRLALNQRRGLRQSQEILVESVPELARLAAPGNEPYRAAAQTALHAAFGALSARQRNILRLHYIEGLSVDQLGTLYGTHRATAARWIARAREQILDGVAADVQGRFGLTRSEVHSVLVSVRSQLDVSVSRLLGTTG